MVELLPEGAAFAAVFDSFTAAKAVWAARESGKTTNIDAINAKRGRNKMNIMLFFKGITRF